MTLVRVNNPIAKSFDGMMNDIFNEFPSTLSKTFREDVLHFPPVNIIDTPAAYQLHLAAPGFDKADFKIKLEAKVLTISAEKKEVALNENDKMIRREFSSKTFKRSFTIDEKIEAESINARYENGVLFLEFPKKEAAKMVSKEINIL